MTLHLPFEQANPGRTIVRMKEHRSCLKLWWFECIEHRCIRIFNKVISQLNSKRQTPGRTLELWAFDYHKIQRYEWLPNHMLPLHTCSTPKTPSTFTWWDVPLRKKSSMTTYLLFMSIRLNPSSIWEIYLSWEACLSTCVVRTLRIDSSIVQTPARAGLPVHPPRVSRNKSRHEALFPSFHVSAYPRPWR